jgi:3-methyladenine DNA glycosylase AlkD
MMTVGNLGVTSFQTLTRLSAAVNTSKPNILGYTKVARALRRHADSHKAAVSRGFFKDPGNDLFLGVRTPEIRRLAREFYALPLPEVEKLMRSRVHEERSLAHAILRLRFEKGNAAEQKTVFDFYIKNRTAIRAWDGVDDSAPYIVGPYLLERNKKLLYRLARSSSLWDRRIAMVATWWFIRAGRCEDTLRLAAMLLDDQEDLIHKATGWMLREVGQRDLKALKRFLQTHCLRMPRTTLRYAIERFTPEERQRYLNAR